MRIILCLLISFGIGNCLYGQSAINSAGSSVPVSNGQYHYISYSIGQGIVNTSQSNSNFNFHIGFDQDYSDTTYHKDTTALGYYIDSIPNMTIFSDGQIKFFVKSKYKGSGIGFAIKLLDSVKGQIIFLANRQYFEYIGDTADIKTFRIAFITTMGISSDTQIVNFTVQPRVVPENSAFGLPSTQTPPDPSSSDYLIVSDISNSGKTYFNGDTQKVKTIEITGMDVIFQRGNANALYNYSGETDIQEMDIYAERVFIKDTLFLPGTKVKIFAKQLIFEDNGAINSYINTTPVKPGQNAYNSNGITGQQAGEIDLYLKEYESKPVIRFIQVGGEGQYAPTNQGGNAGAGGNLYSTLPLKDFSIRDGGKGGLGKTLPAIYYGSAGNYVENNNKFSYLHPNYLRLIMKYCNDAYYLAFNDTVLNKLVPYINEIQLAEADSNWINIPDTLQLEIQQVVNEMSKTVNQLNNSLDFFGNPPGWVPMLSFEANELAYQNDIQQAINILYLDYWIRNSADSVQAKIDAFTAAKNQLAADVTNKVTDYNNNVSIIPTLQNEIQQDSIALSNLQKEYTNEANSLIAADQKAKQTGLLGIINTVAQIASLLPIPGVQEVGIGVVAGITAYNDISSKNYSGALTAAGNGLTDIEDPKTTSDLTQYDNDIDGIPGQISNLFGGSFDSTKNAIKNLGTDYNKLNTTYQGINKIITQSEQSDQVVSAQLSQVEANNPALVNIKNSIAQVQANEQQIVQAWNAAIQAIQHDGLIISQDVLSVDALNLSLSNLSRVLDNRTLLYLDNMDDNAIYNLRKYHYTMGKAYEYRTLQPYPGTLNLESLFNSMKTIVQAGQGYALSQSDFNSLAAVYEQEIQTIAAIIFNEYNSNSPSLSVPVRFLLSKEQLTSLNAGISVTINPVDLGIFPPNEEDMRIIDFKVIGMKATPKGGTLGTTSYLDLSLTYPNFSRIKKNGQVYLFNNYDINTVNPITWGARYDLLSHNIDSIVPSPATNSLLETLLGLAGIAQTNANILLYSQPSAWADITLSKNLVNIGGTASQVNIDSLRFELIYEFENKPVSNSDIEIVFNEPWMKPLLQVGAKDQYGRQDGYGSIYRSYNKSLNNVGVSAPQTYGQYEFEKWTNLSGNDIQNGKSTTYSFGNYNGDVGLMANYKLTAPELSAPDTVYVLKNDPQGKFMVENSNSGSSKMYWTISIPTNKYDTLYYKYDTSITITIADTGTNNGGNISFKVSRDTSLPYYKIVLVSPYAANGLDTVYIKKVDHLSSGINQANGNTLANQIKIFPNPTNSSLNVILPPNKNFYLAIYDLQGKLIKSFPGNYVRSNIIDVSDIHEGTYFLQIQNNQAIVRKEIVVLK